MPYFLISLACFQYVFGVLSMRDTPLYVTLNPYVLLMPFVLVWLGGLGLLRRSADKNVLVGCLAVALIQTYVFPAYRDAADFPFSFLRSFQYFWGPAILLPSLLGVFAAVAFNSPETASETARTYIKGLCLIASAITLGEVLAVDVLGMSPLTLPYVDPNSIDVFPFRPWGLTAAPQPNALVLAFLFWLSYLYGVRGLPHKLLTLAALAVTQGGTGQVAFFALLPLLSRRPFLIGGFATLPVAIIVAVASYTHQNATGSVWQKFDIAYVATLAQKFIDLLQLFLPRFTANELMFGSATGTLVAATGMTHDWAYFDVFYVYGIVGVAGYLLLYGVMIFLACPIESGASRRIYFTLVALVMNFHYATLNYYVGQFLFTTLAALQVCRSYRSARSSARHAYTPFRWIPVDES